MGMWLKVNKGAAHKGDQVTLSWGGAPGDGKLLVDNGWGPGNRWEVTGKTSDSNVHIIFDSGTTEQFFLVYQPDDGGKEQCSNCVYVKVKAPGEPVDSPPVYADIGLSANPTSAARGDKVAISWNDAALQKHLEAGFSAFVNGGQGKEYPASENPPGTGWTIMVDPGAKQQFFITVRDGGGKPVCYSNTIYVSATKPKTASLAIWSDFNLKVDATEQATGETVKLTYGRSANLKDGQKIFVNCGQGYDWPEEQCRSGTDCHILVAPGETQQFFIVVKEGDTPVAYSNTCHVKAKGFPGLDKLNIDPAQLGPKIKLFGAFPMDEDVAGSGPGYKNISAQIERGKSLKLRWDIEGPLSDLKIDGAGPVTMLQQEVVVTPGSDCNYVLKATNSKGQTSKATIWVAVHQPGEEWSYHVPLQPFTPDHVEQKKKDADGDIKADVGVDWEGPKDEETDHEETDEEGKKEWYFVEKESTLKEYQLGSIKGDFHYFTVEFAIKIALSGKSTKLGDLNQNKKDEIKKDATEKLSLWWKEVGAKSKYDSKLMKWTGKWFDEASVLKFAKLSVKEGAAFSLTIYSGSIEYGGGEAGSLSIGVSFAEWNLEEKDWKLFPLSVSGEIPLVTFTSGLPGSLGELTIAAAVEGSVNLNVKELLAESAGEAGEVAEEAEELGEEFVEAVGGDLLVVVGAVIVVTAIMWATFDAIADAYTDFESKVKNGFNLALERYKAGFKAQLCSIVEPKLPHDAAPEGIGEDDDPAGQGAQAANHFGAAAWKAMIAKESTRKWMAAVLNKRDKDAGLKPTGAGPLSELQAEISAGAWTGKGDEAIRGPLNAALSKAVSGNLDKIMEKAHNHGYAPMKEFALLAFAKQYSGGGGNDLLRTNAIEWLYGVKRPGAGSGGDGQNIDGKWYIRPEIPYQVYVVGQDSTNGTILSQAEWKKLSGGEGKGE